MQESPSHWPYQLQLHKSLIERQQGIAPVASSDTTTVSPTLSISTARHSLVITIANGLGVISGILLDMLTAARFGLGREMDTFFLAATIPQMLVSVFNSIGARAMVPVFTRVLSEENKRDFESFLSTVLAFGLLAMGAGVAVFFLISPVVIRALSPRLSGMDFKLAVRILRILCLSLLPLAVVEPLRAVHLSHGRFFLASITNAVRFSAVIVILSLLYQPWGILALAWGHALGTLAQAVCLMLSFYWHGGRCMPVLLIRHPAIRTLLHQFVPPLIGELTGQSNIIVERFLASFLPPGTVSALGYSRRIVTALHGLFVNSVGTALLPHLSLETLQQSREQIRRLTLLGIRLTTFFTGLVMVSTMALSRPLVGLLFRRGAFDQSAVEITARLLTIFVPSILLMSISYLMMTVLYTYQETRLVMRLRLALLGITVLFDGMLLKLWDGAGLAAAYTLAQLFYLVIVYIALSRYLGCFARDIKLYLIRLLGPVLVAGIIMALVCSITWFKLSGPLLHLLQLVSAFGVGSGLYLILTIGLRLLSWRDIKQFATGMVSRRSFFR